jgi:peptide/nickel transport system permease protein
MIVQIALRRLAPRELTGRLSMALVAVLLVLAVVLPIVGQPHTEQRLIEQLQGPRAAHPLGTDQLGRDQLSRIAAATRGSLTTVGVVLVIAGVGGGAVGLLSGYFGGTFDLLLQRAIDAMMAVPLIVLALAVVTAFGASAWTMNGAIAFVFTPLSVRVARSSALSLRTTGYVESAMVSGASSLRIITRHLAPGAAGPWSLIVAAQAGGAVLTEATLSFLGAVPPGRPSLGSLLGGEAQTYMYTAPWLIIWPGVVLALLALAANLAGDWLAEKFRAGGGL